MGKVVKFTGSKLLGDELRRLRGERSLEDVVEMGRSKLSQFGFRTIAKTSLSEIENGKTLPNIESVFALSILYQIPTSRFLHLLLAENLLDEMPIPEGADELRAAFAKAVHEQRPTDALALATHALKRAAPGWDALRWRLNRATAIDRLGMRADAVAELQEAIDHPDMPQQVRCIVHFDLSRMHASVGQFSFAEMNLQRAMTLTPTDAPQAVRADMLQAKARLTAQRGLWGQVLSDSDLREAEDALSAASRMSPEATAADRLALIGIQALLAAFRSDMGSGRALFSTLLIEARTQALPDRQVEALMGLAHLERREHPDRARRYLTEAAELAVANNHAEKAFLIYFDLHALAPSQEQRAHFLRKCQRLYPLIQSSHPSVRAFEQLGKREQQ